MALLSVTLLFVLLIQQFAAGLQVTPNSPCSSVCIDSNDLDYSDPNSSNTKGSDIVCNDADFTSSGPGMKWEKCMSCLQNSTYAQGSESDQMWFLYNLRYSFDYCVFGFPNATNVGSNPCITSTACGGLEIALQDGDLNAQGLQAYGYCDADGAAMTGDSYQKCLACVSASGDDDYISNALIALEAGCLQRPAAGAIVGLNDTVFANGVIGIVDPNTVPTQSTKSSSHISIPMIAGIIAGVLVLIAAIAAFLFVRYRKRNNQAMRANPRWGRHRPKSSLSFRCQKVLSPMSPKFFMDAEDSSLDDMSEAVPERRHIESKPKSNAWTPPMPASSFQSLSAVSAQQVVQPNSFNLEKKGSASGGRGSLPLRSITTNVPALPQATHASPNATRSSPASAATTETYFSTPTSTTQLIPTGFSAYVPAEHGVASARSGSEPLKSPTLINLTSPSIASPRLNQHGWPAAVKEQSITFPPPPPPKGVRVDTKRPAFKKGKRESGSPTESRQIQLSFAAPPTKR